MEGRREEQKFFCGMDQKATMTSPRLRFRRDEARPDSKNRDGRPLLKDRRGGFGSPFWFTPPKNLFSVALSFLPLCPLC
jgi:hypothetical protein